MKGYNLIQEIGWNTIIQSFGKLLSIGLSFITVAFLTRYLGSSGYGNYTLVFSYLGFFSIIADFGLQLAIVKEIATLEKDHFSLYGTYFLLKVSLIIISNVLALTALYFFPYSMQLKFGIVIGAFAVSVSGMMGYFNAIFQARLRLDLLTYLDIAAKVVTVAGIVLAVFFKLNFYLVISAVLLGNTVSFFCGFLLLKHTVHFSFNRSVALKLLLISFPIGITSFLSTLYFKVDTIILSLFRSSSDVGIYSLAYKVLENILVFWGFYMAPTYPLLARLKIGEVKAYKKLLFDSSVLALLSSVPIIIVVIIFAPWIIDVFAGSSFLSAVLPLQILIFSVPILFLNNVIYNFYILEQKNIIAGVSMVIALGINLLLNFIYIPKYGYIAASYTTVLSALVLFICYLLGSYFVRKDLFYEKGL